MRSAGSQKGNHGKVVSNHCRITPHPGDRMGGILFFGV
jgi:hypothetical protein